MLRRLNTTPTGGHPQRNEKIRHIYLLKTNKTPAIHPDHVQKQFGKRTLER